MCVSNRFAQHLCEGLGGLRHHAPNGGGEAASAKVAQAWLERNVPSHVTPDEWPAHSPDLNPIENAWARMKEHVAYAQPKNLEQLRAAILAAWNTVMTPEYCRTLAESMDRRLRAVRTRQGGHTKY